MKRVSLSLAIGILLILGIGGLVYWQKQKAIENEMLQQAAEQQPSAAQGTYTATQVAEHANATSCWSVINGNVYDLTAWIPKHPGGERAILQLCGTDGSAKFNGQHGGAALQAQILAGFKIGVAQ